jgi:hypothetical protein
MQQQGTSSFEPDSDSMNPDTKAARVEIERTRERMSDTIEAISKRLDPHTLSRQAKGAVRDATIGRVENAAKSAGATAKDALTTAGESLSGVAHKVKDTIVSNSNTGSAHDQATDPIEVHSMSPNGSDKSSAGVLRSVRMKVGAPIREGMAQAQSGFRQGLERKPLVVGVILVGLGALAGFAIPETEQENRFLARMWSRPFLGGRALPDDQAGRWTV